MSIDGEPIGIYRYIIDLCQREAKVVPKGKQRVVWQVLEFTTGSHLQKRCRDEEQVAMLHNPPSTSKTESIETSPEREISLPDLHYLQ